MVRQRFLVPSLTGSSPVPAIVRLDKLHHFKVEEGQILYGAWYGVGALLMRAMLSWQSKCMLITSSAVYASPWVRFPMHAIADGTDNVIYMVHDHGTTSTGAFWVVPRLWRFDSTHQH